MFAELIKKLRLTKRRGSSEQNVFMCSNPLYAKYAIGKWTYGNPRIYDWGGDSTLEIGRFCSIADDVTIMLGGEHRTDWVTTFPFCSLWENAPKIEGHPSTKGNIIIENDVWIGNGATILSGVTIGSGAVIGAKSLVTRDVPPYTIAGGNPCRNIRSRFSDDIVERLLAIAWWNWEPGAIFDALPLLLSGNIHLFVQKHDCNGDWPAESDAR